jgi:hypothetical protein
LHPQNFEIVLETGQGMVFRQGRHFRSILCQWVDVFRNNVLPARDEQSTCQDKIRRICRVFALKIAFIAVLPAMSVQPPTQNGKFPPFARKKGQREAAYSDLVGRGSCSVS